MSEVRSRIVSAADADARAIERNKASVVALEVMPWLAPNGWGTTDYVMHAAALMALPSDTIELIARRIPEKTG